MFFICVTFFNLLPMGLITCKVKILFLVKRNHINVQELAPLTLRGTQGYFFLIMAAFGY